jgi:hypothetical protein
MIVEVLWARDPSLQEPSLGRISVFLSVMNSFELKIKVWLPIDESCPSNRLWSLLLFLIPT